MESSSSRAHHRKRVLENAWVFLRCDGVRSGVWTSFETRHEVFQVKAIYTSPDSLFALLFDFVPDSRSWHGGQASILRVAIPVSIMLKVTETEIEPSHFSDTSIRTI